MLTSELSEKAETHADRPDLAGEYLTDVQIHLRAKAQVSAYSASARNFETRTVVSQPVPWKARYRKMKKIPKPLPTLFVVPAYCAIIAQRQLVVTRQPAKPTINMPRRELTLSCSHAPPGL